MTSVEQRSEVDEAAVQAAFGQVMTDFAASIGVTTLLLGITSGAWKAMSGAGPLTPGSSPPGSELRSPTPMSGWRRR